jgi:hypothetical protein
VGEALGDAVNIADTRPDLVAHGLECPSEYVPLGLRLDAAERSPWAMKAASAARSC